jgi:hypothetical protein
MPIGDKKAVSGLVIIVVALASNEGRSGLDQRETARFPKPLIRAAFLLCATSQLKAGANEQRRE